MTIRRYLSRLLLGRLLGVLIGLSAMLQLLELFEKAGTIFAHGGFLDILHFIGLRLPAILTESLPLAVLIGALLAFRSLAAGLEVTTLRAAGKSIGQMVAALMPLCLLLTLIQFGLQNEVAPRADRAFEDWWARTIPAAADAPAPPPLWLRAGGNVASVDRVSLDGRHLEGVTLIERSAEGVVTAEITAPRADITAEGWVLALPRIAAAGHGEIRQQASFVWPAGPTPANMVALARPTDSQTLEHLLSTLRGRWIGSQSPSYYRTALYEAFAVLFSPLIMLLLAAPVLLVPPRAEGNGMAAATSLVLGLGYLVCAGLLNAFGESGAVPPWLAGWLAPVSFLAYALLRMMQSDDA